jgi:ribonuclease Z
MADSASAFKDDALHILLCGTGSPMPDPKRADACTAIIAGGHVVIIDTGPGAWTKLVQANVPPAKIDTVLLTPYRRPRRGRGAELDRRTQDSHRHLRTAGA